MPDKSGPHIKLFPDQETLEIFLKKCETYKDNVPALCKEVVVNEEDIPSGMQPIACDYLILPGPKYQK